MPTPLFAFGFASPLLLWGLALGGVPVIIHLLYKRRYREVPWAAMRFLLAAARKNSRRLRLEQLILLAVRTLILVLLALALARPFVESLGTYFQADLPTHRLVVIDASYSMGYQPADQRRFDRAKDVARQIIGAAQQGDALNLVRISGAQPHVIVRRPAYQAAPVLEEIEQLELTDERGDVAAVLKEVEPLLHTADEIPHKEVYLITDLQQENWNPSGNEESALIREQLKKIAAQAQLVWIDVGQSGSQNAAVTDFQAAEPFVTAGRPVHLQATLRNYGSSTLPSQLVELYADGKLVETRRVDLSASAETQTHFTHTFSTSGEHQLEVRLEEDALPTDNHRWLALPVKEDLQVLLVNGKPSGKVMGNATDYLRLALAPSLPNEPSDSQIHPTVINEGELPGVDLSRYDCVFLCNVALFTEREADILRAYAEAGGGVVFCLGSQVKPRNYNQVLYRDGKGLLPARLGERVGNAERKEQTFDFDPGDFSHPIVRPFQGNPNAGLEATKTFEYFQAVPAPNKPARVALRFDTGDPAIVESPVGRGRVILVTTSVDRDWSTWAVWGHSLVPLMHETVNFAVAGRWAERDLMVGESVTRSFATRALDATATLKVPGGEQRTLTLQPSEGVAGVTLDSLTRSGVYELVLGPPLNRTQLFAVNVEPREGDLAKLEEDALHSDLLPGSEFVYRTQWEDTPPESEEAPVAERGGLTRWLLMAVLCLVVIEPIMAWNFWYGFVALLGVIAVVLSQSLLAWSPAMGLAVVIALAGGAWWIWRRSPSRNTAR